MMKLILESVEERRAVLMSLKGFYPLDVIMVPCPFHPAPEAFAQCILIMTQADCIGAYFIQYRKGTQFLICQAGLPHQLMALDEMEPAYFVMEGLFILVGVYKTVPGNHYNEALSVKTGLFQEIFVSRMDGIKSSEHK